MASSFHSSHGHDHHHWDSAEYVSNWAKGQDPKESNRQEAFRMLADTIPFNKTLPIRILDLGAGYGGLTKFLLESFPNATAVCQDGSKEMAKLGGERMKNLAGRFEYVLCDFAEAGWSQKLKGPFEAVVSSIAIHNVGEPKIIQRIYEDVFPLVKTGGCFLNFDRHRPPIADQMQWLRGAGFADVQCFWQDENRAVFGGFKRA
jgi:ubiquinone/menaquinone biosynthesis C-methylase UbiE